MRKCIEERELAPCIVCEETTDLYCDDCGEALCEYCASCATGELCPTCVAKGDEDEDLES